MFNDIAPVCVSSQEGLHSVFVSFLFYMMLWATPYITGSFTRVICGAGHKSGARKGHSYQARILNCSMFAISFVKNLYQDAFFPSLFDIAGNPFHPVDLHKLVY